MGRMGLVMRRHSIGSLPRPYNTLPPSPVRHKLSLSLTCLGYKTMLRTANSLSLLKPLLFPRPRTDPSLLYHKPKQSSRRRLPAQLGMQAVKFLSVLPSRLLGTPRTTPRKYQESNRRGPLPGSTLHTCEVLSINGTAASRRTRSSASTRLSAGARSGLSVPKKVARFWSTMAKEGPSPSLSFSAFWRRCLTQFPGRAPVLLRAQRVR